MQVISGQGRRQRVHFEAPPATQLPAELNRFLSWVISARRLAHSLRADHDAVMVGGGDGSPQRFYRLSAQIQRERKDYYDVLERTQKGTLDVTD